MDVRRRSAAVTFDTRERPQPCPRSGFARVRHRPGITAGRSLNGSHARPAPVSRRAGDADVGGRDVQSFAVSSECLGLEKSQ
ncbi:hypothetical protein GCM10010182_57340 [Actinomadura cremea]|nr:hypothetical protein GCM10010182_57340 [Actinomadura cremea]